MRSARFLGAAVTLVLLAGCSTQAVTHAAPPSSGSAGPEPSAASVPASPTKADLAAVQAMFQELNTTGGGPVEIQRRVLGSIVAPGQAATQARCPTATNTLVFEPVYDRLAPAPTWSPPSGTTGGTMYSLPTLIRIYTGDRITATDLADVHLDIEAGRPGLMALCIS